MSKRERTNKLFVFGGEMAFYFWNFEFWTLMLRFLGRQQKWSTYVFRTW